MLIFNGVALRQGGRLLFEQASFQISSGQKVGITGANGAGKSSLFSLILGDLAEDSGHFEKPQSWRLAHVAQHVHSGDQTALAYVLAGDTVLAQTRQALAEAEAAEDWHRLPALHEKLHAINGYDAEARAARLLDGLGFAPDTLEQPVGQFSGGWQMRLALGRALMCPSDLLLLDEPTNHLDLDAVIWLEDWLRQYPGCLLLISHDRDFLDRIVGHILHIEQKQLSLFSGNYSAFECQRAEQLAQQKAAYEKQERARAHMEDFVRRFRAKATKARQAQSRIKAIERMASIAPAHVDSPFRFSFEDLDPGTHQLISLERLSAGYGDHRVIERISHGLLPGDKLGLLGPNGAGKSTLVKVLAGDQQDLLGDSHLPEGQPDILSGQRHSVKTLRVGYFAQHQVDQLRLDWSPLQHLQNLDPSAREQQLRGYLGGFGFSGDMATEPVGPRSGGEKARLVLAILVYRKPNVLLLDEPTNHLDLDMRLALNLALQSFAGALVLVSHDRHLLRSLCDSFLLVADGQAVPWAGDLDDYARWLSERRRASEAATKPATGNSVLTRHARTRRKATASLNAELRPLRQRLRHIEKNMDFLQKQKDDLDDEMAAPELYDQSPDKVAALGERHGRITAELEDLEMAWLEVSEAIEALSG